MLSNRLGLRSADQGSAVVEFALLLPILMVVILALVQVGLLARDELLLTQAARAGARQAAVDPDDGAVRSVAVEAAVGLDPAFVQVVVARSGAQGDPVAVSVGYEVPVNVPLLGWLFPPTVPLHATATMRQEFP